MAIATRTAQHINIQSFLARFSNLPNTYEDTREIVDVKQGGHVLLHYEDVVDRATQQSQEVAQENNRTNEREERKRQFRAASRTYVQVCVQPNNKRLSSVGDVAKCAVQLGPAVSTTLLICSGLQICE